MINGMSLRNILKLIMMDRMQVSPSGPEMGPSFEPALYAGSFLPDSPESGNRLVRASKSQTRENHGEKQAIFNPGCFTVIQFREWSDEWRVRTQIETSSQQPQAPEGERSTDMLTDRAARKIADSCHYMALQKGGFSTFVTGTFSEEKRQAIAAGETSIQREVTRTMDAMKKMYLRGWQRESGEKIAPAGAEFCYLWVVEIPKNEQGEDNPHIHLMLNWRVEKKLFSEWAERIERLWANGYFHLEKIKDPLCAGAYMAKAAGYMTKAQNDDSQGKVKGNRYGISKPARAPDWCTMSRTEYGIMARLIADMHDALSTKYGAEYEARRRLNRELSETPKGTRKRRDIGQKLQKVRERISKIPVVCSQYQIVLKGGDSFGKFIDWAGSQGWGQTSGRPDNLWFSRFKNRMRARKERRQLWLMKLSDEEFNSSKSWYEQYSNSELVAI